MATALPSVLDSMKCPICLDFAENAVETECCAQIYCEKCVEDLENEDCPSCREPYLETLANRSVRRMIGELPVDCPNSCGEAVTRATLGSHEESCPRREYQCPIEKCDFSGLSQHLIEHATGKHPKELLRFLTKPKSYHCPFDDCEDEGEMEKQELMEHLKTFHVGKKNDFFIPDKAFLCPIGNCDIQDFFHSHPPSGTGMSRQDLKDHIFKSHAKEWRDEIFQPTEGPIKILNCEGRTASMAPNGKFYCGTKHGAYKHPDRKKETQTECTYENRLNCRSCMKMDVTLRNLPYGSLVNGDGRVAVPVFCTHRVKGSEYFAGNSRSALCRLDTCGHTPSFTCSCNSCHYCRQLNQVYSCRDDTGKGKKDRDYYGFVWDKKRFSSFKSHFGFNPSGTGNQYTGLAKFRPPSIQYSAFSSIHREAKIQGPRTTPT